MRQIIVAVHDRQLDAFMRPFVAATEGQAIRSFRDEVNRSGSELNAHPEDYTLYKIGEWDEATGSIHRNQNDRPEQLELASNLIQKGKS